MREIIILSGKGGTGKTSLAGAFISLAGRPVACDCDVDAADLHILLKPEVICSHDFFGRKAARIIQEKCSRCGKCFELCHFDAVLSRQGEYGINQLACEGCGVCQRFCPENAIVMEDMPGGKWFESGTRFGPMIHAKLGVSGENSGRLVTIIRKKSREIAEGIGADYLITDGPPGIGCPVIASLTGADYAVIVTEPTVSGIHDLERIAKLSWHFGIKTGIIVNRSDINPGKVVEAEKFAAANDILMLGAIPWDRAITGAQFAGQTITEFSTGGTAGAIKQIWEKICRTVQ
jgi:MinD superfamily P-loop ATPase